MHAKREPDGKDSRPVQVLRKLVSALLAARWLSKLVGLVY